MKKGALILVLRNILRMLGMCARNVRIHVVVVMEVWLISALSNIIVLGYFYLFIILIILNRC